MAKGLVRFQGWHCDAPHYKRNPARFTLFRVVKLPTGPDVTIRWDDGSDYSMKSPPGRTLFFSSEELYEQCLSDEEKQLVDHSWVEYSAWPYEYTLKCKVRPTGLGTVSDGAELSEEGLKALRPNQEDLKIVSQPPRDHLSIQEPELTYAVPARLGQSSDWSQIFSSAVERGQASLPSTQC